MQPPKSYPYKVRMEYFLSDIIVSDNTKKIKGWNVNTIVSVLLFRIK